MTYRVVVTARARADALEAFRWRAGRSARSAPRWFAGLEKVIAELGQFPERHPIAEEESERLGMTFRQSTYGKKPGVYRLLFSIEGDAIVIHSIRHGARGPIDEDD